MPGAGGIYLDGLGDIAVTDPSTIESVQDIVASRLKATLNGWQLYSIGADLQSLPGQSISQELEVTVQRQIQTALTNNFLPRGSFQVETLVYGNTLRALVYLNQALIAQAFVTNLDSIPQVTVT